MATPWLTNTVSLNTGLGGWSSSDVLLIASMRMLAHGLYVLFLGRIQYMNMLVQEGVVDHVQCDQCDRCQEERVRPHGRSTSLI